MSINLKPDLIICAVQLCSCLKPITNTTVEHTAALGGSFVPHKKCDPGIFFKKREIQTLRSTSIPYSLQAQMDVRNKVQD